MYCELFVLAIVIKAGIAMAVLGYVWHRSRRRRSANKAATIQSAVENFVDEMYEESEEYLAELGKVLSR